MTFPDPAAGLQITLFRTEGCPHCRRAIGFLQELAHTIEPAAQGLPIEAPGVRR